MAFRDCAAAALNVAKAAEASQAARLIMSLAGSRAAKAKQRTELETQRRHRCLTRSARKHSKSIPLLTSLRFASPEGAGPPTYAGKSPLMYARRALNTPTLTFAFGFSLLVPVPVQLWTASDQGRAAPEDEGELSGERHLKPQRQCRFLGSKMVIRSIPPKHHTWTSQLSLWTGPHGTNTVAATDYYDGTRS